MATQIIKITDKTHWNSFVINSPSGHLMQSYEWGEFKAALGWEVERVGIEHDGQIVAGAQILFRSLPVLPLTLAYIPKGPIVNLNNKDIAYELFPAVHQTAHQHRAIFLRIEPNLPDDLILHNILKEQGFQLTSHTNQPRSTIIMNLNGGEQTLKSGMRKKTRQLVRRAVRNGVEIVWGQEQDLDEFYQILSSTARLKGFDIHNKFFYEQGWRTFQKADSVRILLAKYKGEVVAVKMIFIYSNTSMHLFGGTSDKGRALNASYLIQWEAIKWAMEHGYQYVDLWGIPDEIATILKTDQDIPKEKQGGLWGVYNFKRGFGGEIVTFLGTYDYTYHTLLYTLGKKMLGISSVDTLSRWLEKLH